MNDITKSDLELAIEKLRYSLNPDESKSNVLIMNGMIKVGMMILQSMEKGHKDFYNCINGMVESSKNLEGESDES